MGRFRRMDKKTDIAPITKKELATVEKTAKAMLDVLQIEGTLKASLNDNIIDIVLDTKDTGVVIGYHGEALESLQLLIALCASKKIGRFVRVSLEVGDYKKNRISWLENLALSAKERSLAEKQEVVLPNLKSWERRVVHMCLQDDKDIVSESVGEGRDRTLIVKPRR